MDTVESEQMHSQPLCGPAQTPAPPFSRLLGPWRPQEALGKADATIHNELTLAKAI